MPRDDVVGHLERYAGEMPVHEGVDVRSARAGAAAAATALETSAGELLAGTVVLCSGAYQRPHARRSRTRCPDGVARARRRRLHATRPSLPPGPVLVIGSGQTGCQLAEELREAGREVFLVVRARAVAGAADGRPRRPLVGARDGLPRRHGGVAAAPGGALRGQHQRHRATAAATTCTCARCTRWACGCSATSRAADGRHARFADDLAASVAWGDERRADFVALMRTLVAERGLPEPELPDPEPLRRRAAARARPRRLRRRDPHRRLPPRLRALGRRARRVRRARLPAAREGAVDRRAGPVVRRRALPAPAPVGAAVRGRRGRRDRRPRDRRGA